LTQNIFEILNLKADGFLQEVEKSVNETDVAIYREEASQYEEAETEEETALKILREIKKRKEKIDGAMENPSL